MKTKTRKIVALILNLLVLIFEVSGLTVALTGKVGEGHSLDFFRFFTNDSNVLLLIGTILLLVYQVHGLKDGKEIPKYVNVFYFVSLVGTTLTFLTVLFILIPMMGVGLISSYSMVCLHLICPILSVIDFLFFDDDFKLKLFDSFFGMIPMTIYGVIILILVGIKSIEPPYPFLDIYNQKVYISVLFIILMFAMTYLICFLLYFFGKKTTKIVKEKVADKK